MNEGSGGRGFGAWLLLRGDWMFCVFWRGGGWWVAFFFSLFSFFFSFLFACGRRLGERGSVLSVL